VIEARGYSFAVGVGLGKSLAQHPVEQEARFKVRSGRGILDPAHAVAQVEFLGSPLDCAQQALQTPPQVRGLADVRLGAGLLAAQYKHGRSRRDGSEDRRIVLSSEFQTLGQHHIILVRNPLRRTSFATDLHGFTRTRKQPSTKYSL
jgi:hypothetical protein